MFEERIAEEEDATNRRILNELLAKEEAKLRALSAADEEQHSGTD